MNVLILGSGGREHALAEAYNKSAQVEKVFVVPGNGLIGFLNKKISSVPNLSVMDFSTLLSLVKKEKIDLVDVAPDDLIAAGLADKFQEQGFKAFGASQKASEIEWNKEWARNFMKKYKLPIPKYESFSDKQKAISYVNSFYNSHPGASAIGSRFTRSRALLGSSSARDSSPAESDQNDNKILFIKASGLALGKGVIRADTKDQAIDAISQMESFGKAGETFLIEEGLIGEEFSLFAICDGEDYVVAGAAQDHKTVFENDKGPNTGGMGCVAPPRVVDRKIIAEAEEKIIRPLLKGMILEKRPYKGILYLGGMLTRSASSGQARSASSGQAGVKIIEFNARWGDPEAEVILPSLQTDYLDIVEGVITGNLRRTEITFDTKVRVSVAGCSKGYPGDYSSVKGKEISGLRDAMELKGVTIYGAGIKREGNRFFANGGRIFHLVAEGDDIFAARKLAYSAMSMIYIHGDNLHYRKDIGWRDVRRMEKKLL